MVKEVHRLQRIVSDVPDLAVTAANIDAQPANAPVMTQLHNAFDPPGVLSADGPRHDNDHVEISEIYIHPTQQEITCSRAPFLPSNGLPDSPHFLAHGWKRQVDTHFRLYREDTLEPLRRSTMLFLDALKQTPSREEDRLLKNKELCELLDNNVSLNVYSNVQVFGMIKDKNTVGIIKIGISQPPQIQGGAVSKRKRSEFWERSKNRLMYAGLVCLISPGSLDSEQNGLVPKAQVILAKVVQRYVASLAKCPKMAKIGIKLVDPQQYLLLMNSASEASSKNWFLVESPGSCFGSYRPILKALQQSIPASLPFGKYLAPTIEEQAEITKVSNFVDPPIFAQAPTFQYNLSVLLDGQECRLDVNSTTSVEQAIRTLQAHGNLDNSQVTALVDTLCREVALINGPPGTGKTWISTVLMQVLLANKAQSTCGPILYICYTSRTLDQVLDHLLDKGVLDIVRVGARSESERLEQYNLKALTDVYERPHHVWKAISEAKHALESDGEEIKKIEQVMRRDCLQWEHVRSHLKLDYPKLFNQFQTACNGMYASSPNKNDSGELDKVDSKGCSDVESKKRSSNHPFDRWKTGQDIQEMKEYNEEAQKRWENRANDPEHNPFDTWSDNTCNNHPQPPDLRKIPSTNRSDNLIDGDIWEMSMNEREHLLNQWRPKVQGNLMIKLGELIKHVEDLNGKKYGAMDEIRRGILRQCSVVGMTARGAAKYQELIKHLAPRIIICEEAGQILESHILAALTPSTQHLILIGDHKQLRPQIESFNLSSDSPIGKKYNLDMSLFERLATFATNPLPVSTLTTQRRMRPCISNLIRQPLYPDLLDGCQVHEYPPVCGMAKDMFFMHHNHPEDVKIMNGVQLYSNTFEVDMVKALASYLIKNGYDQPGDITILTPDLGQLSKLRDALKGTAMLVINERDQQDLDQNDLQEELNGQDSMHHQDTPIRVDNVSLQKQLTLHTIDNYQGEVAKVNIISLVQNTVDNHHPASRKIRSLISPNRTNVILTSAQQGMFIIGNADLMAQERSGIWPSVIKDLRSHGRLGAGFPLMCKNHPDQVRIVELAEQLDVVAPDGGCTLNCSRGMPCGHICPRQC
ncbi:hypothetical protein BGZ82_000484 [Podila clonocystis]|nr:hypothetical protein BGZ82_000484 [Podila clonocystis]